MKRRKSMKTHTSLLTNFKVAVRGMLLDARNILAGLGLCVVVYWIMKFLETVR